MQNRKRRTSPRGPSAPVKDRAYEMYKQQWLLAHPNASPDEYQRAMTEIARKIGL